MPRFVLLLLLPAVAVSCFRPRAVTHPRPQERAAGKLLAELRERWSAGDQDQLALLFAPECRSGCTGFVPTPTRVGVATVTGHWWPRLVAGSLIGDLLLARTGYARLDHLELQTVAVRVYHLEVVLRVRLLLEGRDPAGRALSDRGELDLRLRETPAGLRVAALAPRRVTRSVALLPEERTGAELAASPSSQPERAEDSEGRIEGATSAPSDGEEASATASEEESAQRGLLELRVERKGAPVARLGAFASGRATLLWVYRGRAPDAATCDWLAREALKRREVSALLLALESPAGAPSGRAARCSLPTLTATRSARRALGWLHGLLPSLLLLDKAGRVRRVAGEGAGRLEILEALDAL